MRYTMDITIETEEPFGREAYAKLFDEIMSDLNKATMIERAHLTLRPDIPLFVFSIVLKAAPAPKTIGDVANVRLDVAGVHITITEERYAPDILKALFEKYGRQNVVQQTRFDLDVKNSEEKEVAGIIVSDGEEDSRDIMGALWRSMPEGIKNRKTFVTGGVITVVATEEIMRPEMLAAGRQVHEMMGGVCDV